MKTLCFFILFPLLYSCSNDDKTIANYQTEKQVWAETPLKTASQSSSNQGQIQAPAKSRTNKSYAWKTPPNWTEKAGNSIRIGSFSLTSKDGQKSADLSIVTLMGKGGGVVANINRWRGQLELASESEKQVMSVIKGVKGQVGIFKTAFLKNNQNAQGMLVAMFFGKQRTLFIKAKGDTSVLVENEKIFDTFLRSIYVP